MMVYMCTFIILFQTWNKMSYFYPNIRQMSPKQEDKKLELYMLKDNRISDLALSVSMYCI